MSARSHGSAAAGRGGAQAAATVRDFARKLAHRSARKRPALARIVSGIPTAPARPALAPPSEDATGARRCRGQAPPRCPRIAAMYLRCRQTLRAQIVNADAVATRIEPADPETAAGRRLDPRFSQAFKQRGREIALGERGNHHDDGFSVHVLPCGDLERGGDGGARRNAAGNSSWRASARAVSKASSFVTVITSSMMERSRISG